MRAVFLRNPLFIAFLLSASLLCLLFYLTQRKRHQNGLDPSTGTDRFTNKFFKLTTINIAFIIHNIENSIFAHKLDECIQSILDHSSTRSLRFIVISDQKSKSVFTKILRPPDDAQIMHFDLDTVSKQINSSLPAAAILQFFTQPGAYYNDMIFAISPFLHRILTAHQHSIQKVIVLDSDLLFVEDIGQLFDQFDDFDADSVIGLTYEMQPTYRHMYNSFREKNPGTTVGEPPSSGLPGFNSGVMLMDLERMRDSELYNSLLNRTVIANLLNRYDNPTGHLGGQDFFTLIGFEHSKLIHVLGCEWNRQLCTWWRENGYKDVFDSYFQCNRRTKVFHGNCNSHFPAH